MTYCAFLVHDCGSTTARAEHRFSCLQGGSMSPVRKVLTLAFFLTLLAATLAQASITGSICGVVSDSSGAVIGGATVTATNTQTGVQVTLKTDSKGFYNFPSLQIGTYTVEVQVPGFKTANRTDIVIDANSALRADFTLQVGQSRGKVTVTAETAHMQTESTRKGRGTRPNAIT